MVVNVDDVYVMRGKLGFVCTDLQQFNKTIAGATLFTKREADRYYEHLSKRCELQILKVTNMEIEE